MKLVRATKTKLLFHLGRREDHLFREILKLYPRVPSAHHVLSKSGRLPHREADQRLLDEALAEQRAEHKKQVTALLADPQRLAPAETGSHLSLRHTEVDWLLQVHEQGKSVLARESLEKAEHYVHQLQKYTLNATMERDE